MADNIPHDDLHDLEPLPEGEETAPPYTRTMAVVRWILFAGMLLFATVMVLSYLELTPWASAEEKGVQYHCPMHPTYITAQPGDCPICGMSLVQIGGTEESTASEHADHADDGQGKQSIAEPGQYYCPMDPEIASDTAGKCSMCGMFLEKFEPGMKFTCEMHPEVVMEKPGDCPKCGMDLMPMESSEEGHFQGSATESNVPGLVEVTIEPKRLQLIGLKTGKAERTTMSGSTGAVGYVTADERKLSTISVRFSGWVKELFVNQTGEQINAGMPLLSVYSQELYQAQQEYLIAREAQGRPINDPSLGNMRKELLAASEQRLRLLGIPEEELKRLQESGKATTELIIRSPYSGVALEKGVTIGQFIAPDQPLFRLADLRTVWVIADLYEQDLSAVTANQKATVKLSAYPGEEFTGKVDFIYPTVTEAARTVRVRVAVDNAKLKLKPGMYADVIFASSSESVLTVPSGALLDCGDKQYVFVMQGGNHFVPRLVTSGRRIDEFIEILDGVSEGDVVVTSANFLIDSESRLQAAITGMGGTSEPTDAADPHAGHGK